MDDAPCGAHGAGVTAERVDPQTRTRCGDRAVVSTGDDSAGVRRGVTGDGSTRQRDGTRLRTGSTPVVWFGPTVRENGPDGI